MSNLEIFLCAALAIVTFQLFRIYRKQLILRHLFIRSSDWCARKINEIVEDASQSIIEIEMARAEEAGNKISEDSARNAIPYVILEAKKEWLEQRDAFQKRLSLNRISPLTTDDLDNLILNPSLAGFK